LENNSQPLAFVEQSEEEQLSRSVLIWLNTFPGLPELVKKIGYEALEPDTACMALSAIQGAYITKRFILGGHQAVYPFKIIYRLKPGKSQDASLKADEFLDKLGVWAWRNKPDLSPLHVLRVEQTEKAAVFAKYENGDEDHQILMKLTYEVI